MSHGISQELQRLCLVYEVPQAVHHFWKTGRELVSRELDIVPSGTLPAHATVKATFEVQYEIARNIPKHLGFMVAQGRIHPTPAYLGELDDFNGGTVHLPIHGEALRDVMNRIIDAFDGLGIKRRGPEGQSPHITILKNLKQHECEAAKRLLNTLEVPSGEFRFDQLVLYAREHEGSWRPIHTLGVARTRAA